MRTRTTSKLAQERKTPRKYIYELLHTVEIDSTFEYVVRIVIGILIVLSILSVMLETMEDFESKYSEALDIFETVTVVIFSIEYLLRLWSAVEIPKYQHPIFGRIRYILSPLSLVDLLAITPFYLPHLTTLDLRFLRGLRLIRLLRVLKLGHYSRSLTLIVKVTKKKRHEIGAAIFLMGLVLVMSSSLMYYIEHEAQPKSFPSIPASMWWGVATLTTVGYGDVYPITTLGKLCSALITIIGIGIVALPSGIIVAGFIEELQTHKAITCPHCNKEIA